MPQKWSNYAICVYYIAGVVLVSLFPESLLHPHHETPCTTTSTCEEPCHDGSVICKAPGHCSCYHEHDCDYCNSAHVLCGHDQKHKCTKHSHGHYASCECMNSTVTHHISEEVPCSSSADCEHYSRCGSSEYSYCQMDKTCGCAGNSDHVCTSFGDCRHLSCHGDEHPFCRKTLHGGTCECYHYHDCDECSHDGLCLGGEKSCSKGSGHRAHAQCSCTLFTSHAPETTTSTTQKSSTAQKASSTTTSLHSVSTTKAHSSPPAGIIHRCGDSSDCKDFDGCNTHEYAICQDDSTCGCAGHGDQICSSSYDCLNFPCQPQQQPLCKSDHTCQCYEHTDARCTSDAECNAENTFFVLPLGDIKCNLPTLTTECQHGRCSCRSKPSTVTHTTRMTTTHTTTSKPHHSLSTKGTALSTKTSITHTTHAVNSGCTSDADCNTENTFLVLPFGNIKCNLPTLTTECQQGRCFCADKVTTVSTSVPTTAASTTPLPTTTSSPKTCQEPCRDKNAQDCKLLTEMFHFCSHSNVSEMCPLSCGLCTINTCEDNSSHDCKLLTTKFHFCTNPDVSKLCPFSCGLCLKDCTTTSAATSPTSTTTTKTTPLPTTTPTIATTTTPPTPRPTTSTTTKSVTTTTTSMTKVVVIKERTTQELCKDCATTSYGLVLLGPNNKN